jgi:hypothetical protein
MACLVYNSMYGILWDLDILLGDHRAWRLLFRGHCVFMYSFRLSFLSSYSTPFCCISSCFLGVVNLFYLLLAGGSSRTWNRVHDCVRFSCLHRLMRRTCFDMKSVYRMLL